MEDHELKALLSDLESDRVERKANAADGSKQDTHLLVTIRRRQ